MALDGTQTTPPLPSRSLAQIQSSATTPETSGISLQVLLFLSLGSLLSQTLAIGIHSLLPCTLSETFLLRLLGRSSSTHILEFLFQVIVCHRYFLKSLILCSSESLHIRSLPSRATTILSSSPCSTTLFAPGACTIQPLQSLR